MYFDSVIKAQIILERRMTFGGPSVEPFICLRTRFGFAKKVVELI